jgi:hypothetical protein
MLGSSLKINPRTICQVLLFLLQPQYLLPVLEHSGRVDAGGRAEDFVEAESKKGIAQ